MIDTSELDFVMSADDRELAALLRDSYQHMAAVPPGQIAQCTSTVLARVASEAAAGAAWSAAPDADAAHAAHASSDAADARALARDNQRVIVGHIRPRWWWGAAAAAALVLTVTRPWNGPDAKRQADSLFVASVAPSAPTGSTYESDGEVRFNIKLPVNAAAVAIVGDFNDWDETRTPMARKSSDGTWSAQVPLPPGRYTYAFVVDGQEWLVDALAPQVPDVGFGPTNAVVVDGAN